MPKGDLHHPKTIIKASPNALEIYDAAEDDDGSIGSVLVHLTKKSGDPNKGVPSWRLQQRSNVSGYFGTVLDKMAQEGLILTTGIPSGEYKSFGMLPSIDLVAAMRWNEEQAHNNPNQIVFLDHIRRVYRKLSKSGFSRSILTDRDRDVIVGVVENYAEVYPDKAKRARAEARYLGAYSIDDSL